MEHPRTSGLPRPAPTSFVGRGAEIAAITALLDGEAFVTILGPPGVGKTRLALEIARRDTRPALWCDLTEARSREDLERVAALALGVPVGGAAAELGAALAERGHVNLVLDNGDDLSAAAAEALGAWRSQAPRVRMLVTSRRRLGLPGEIAFDLAPLPLASDGVRLFVERARAVRRGYEPDTGDAALVTQLVKRLDGLPLAIEIAAGKMRALGVREICDDLSALTAEGSPLGDAIASSWRCLDAAERAVFARCSIFVGSFFLEDAAAVIGGGEAATAELLAALRDRSLLEVGEGASERASYHLLASLRAFAAARLAEEGALAATAARHARRLTTAALAWSERFARLGCEEERRRLALAMENLLAISRRAVGGTLPAEERALAAARAALALDPLLAVRGPWPLRAALLDAAISLLEDDTTVPGEIRARVLLASADARRLGCAAPLGRDDARRALAVAEALGDAALAGRALCCLATLDVVLSDAAAARDHAARARAAGAGDPWVEARALQILGVLDLGAGHLDSARARCTEAIHLARRIDDVLLEAAATGAVARVEQEAHRFAAARIHHEESRALAASVGDRRLEANALANIACSYHDEGDLPGAAGAYERVLALQREIGNRREEALVLACLGAARAALGEIAPAEQSFAASARLLRGAVEPGYETAVEVWRGFLDLARAARASGAEADQMRREAALRLARAEHDAPGVPALICRSPAVRAAARMLRAALKAEDRGAGPLRVAADGAWFEHREGRVRLHRRASLAALLRALAESRRGAPGEALSIAALFAHGWPAQRVAPAVAANRVHNALSTLRSMGLREALIRREDGYLLDPDLAVELGL